MVNTCFLKVFCFDNCDQSCRYWVPMWPNLSKNSGILSKWTSLVDYTSHMLQSIDRGIKCILCSSTGRGLLEAYTWFPPDFAPCAFPFADCASYSFAVINHNHNYNEFWVLMSPESGLEDIWHRHTRKYPINIKESSNGGTEGQNRYIRHIENK